MKKQVLGPFNSLGRNDDCEEHEMITYMRRQHAKDYGKTNFEVSEVYFRFTLYVTPRVQFYSIAVPWFNCD